MTAQFLIPNATGYKVAAFNAADRDSLQGKFPDASKDISGDGAIDLRLDDGRFDSRFACNGCSPRPPRFFTVKNGEVVEESRDPTLRKAFAGEMKRLEPLCLSDKPDRNGACAAYVANAARSGDFKAAWSEMLRHYDRSVSPWQPCDVPVTGSNGQCPEGHQKSFPEALKAFLSATGYLPA
ncbi:hypothetical protein ACU5AX_20510 [Sphingomonas sp. XXL09]|uniref:hypothetical protein n=1 Tax=Sphingomonas sp. XXL09 TaxID=3457787 RepID=UPI00406BA360